VRRREFITLLAGAAATWPHGAGAQQLAKLPTIGFLGSTTPTVGAHWLAAFVQRMRELNWIDGRVAIEVRWAGGRSERFAEIAAEFVRLKVDVIVTSGGAVAEAKQATSVIPIVFALANDPVGAGLVASLARPGGNVTGLSLQSSDLAGKRLQSGNRAGRHHDRRAVIPPAAATVSSPPQRSGRRDHNGHKLDPATPDAHFVLAEQPEQ
jgi:putative tryptophan/tyrosine transport system substrate-binding protein